MEPQYKDILLQQYSHLQQMIQQGQKQQSAVGIEHYLSEGKPIPAVTKYMLTDFIVNEINQQGRLISLKEKPDLKKYLQQPQKQKNQQKPKPEPYQLSKQLTAQLISTVGQQAAKSICNLYARLDAGEKISQWEYLIEDFPNKDKQQRTKFHFFVRQKLRNIQSNFLQGSKMKLKLNKNIKRMSPNSRNKYIHFVLFKSNIDTMGAIFKLSKVTGINQKLFSSAGLKDKRGVTTQMVSVFNTELNKLKKFYSAANKNKQIWIQGFMEDMDDAVGVGSLQGNQFGLILRLVNPEDSQLIHERVQSLKKFGMINYFGMQRFGNSTTKTYMIGLKLIKRKWKQVIQSIIFEDSKNRQMDELKRQCYQKQDYGLAQRSLANKYKIQKNIFKGLKKYGKNYQNVFQSLPRSIRTLYVHSLQSYLWNRIVSRRVKQLGLKIVKGDLIGKKMKGFNLLKAEVQQQKQEKQQNIQQVDKDGQQIQLQDIEQQPQEKYQVELITDQNIQLHTITDVVFPIYGPMINLPHQSLAYQYLNDQLKALQLNEEQFTGKNSKKLCIKGMYRKIIIKPTNVSDVIISHRNLKDQLQSPLYTAGLETKVAEGNIKAVQVVMQLPKSSYATMALRELLHIPSSFQSQMILNKLYQEKNNPERIEQTLKEDIQIQGSDKKDQ